MISYPLYLIHQNLAYLIEYNLSIKFNEFPLNFIGGGALLVVFLVSIIMYYLVEKPIQYRINKKMKKGVYYD